MNNSLTVRLLTIVLVFSGNSSASSMEGGITQAFTPFVVPVDVETASGITATCGGAAISSTIVVTAAHCLFDRQNKLSNKIRVGNPGSSYKYTESNLSSWTPVISILVHPNYSKSNSNSDSYDIAFIKLTSALSGFKQLRIASEAETSLNPLPETLSIFGYGKTGLNGDWPEYPAEIQGRAIRNYNEFEFITQAENQRICDGDSGSPVFIRQENTFKLLGVVSRSSGSGICGSYDFVSTKIRPFLNYAEQLGYAGDKVIESKYNKLEISLVRALTIFETYLSRYENLAPQLKVKLNKNKSWKQFLRLENEVKEIAERSYLGELDYSDIDSEINRLLIVDTLQLKVIDLWKKQLPIYQCVEVRTGQYALLFKGKCPNRYMKVKI